MKHAIIFLTLILSLLISCENDQEIDVHNANHLIGYTTYAGVEFNFNFNTTEISMTNLNDTVIKVKILNLTNNSILVNDLITFAGNTNIIHKANFFISSNIEIQIWRGTSSVYHGSIYDRSADFIGQGTLNEGYINITNSSDKIGYLVYLPVLNGAVCELSGLYYTSNPALQENNMLYCQRISSDTMQIELYKLKPAVTEGYQAEYELASGWIMAQLGEANEIAQINWDFNYNEPLALRVTSYDPFDNSWKNQTVYGFKLNVANESQIEILETITLP